MLSKFLKSKPIRRLINLITFVDLPIRRKFVLFFIGVLFWFLALSVVSIVTLRDLHSRSDLMVKYTVPRDRLAQKIVRELKGMNYDVVKMMHSSSVSMALEHVQTLMARVEDIQTVVSTLKSGGQANDYSRDYDEFIESLTIISIKGDIQSEKYVSDLSSLMDEIKEKVDELTDFKMAALVKNTNITDSGEIESKIEEYRKLAFHAISLSNDFSARVFFELSTADSKKLASPIRYIFLIIGGILLIATVLLVIFTIWISKSIVNPLNSIIHQIRSLGQGEVDLSKRVVIHARDEIGTLSNEFNHLMESIHSTTNFKKVIEEDEKIEDIYSRLGKVFSEKVGLKEFTIYEVSNSQNNMRPVYPVVLSDKEKACNPEILGDCNLCRAKKAGRLISSIPYPRICKQFNLEIQKNHVCIPMAIGGSTCGVVQFLFDNLKGKQENSGEIDRKIFRAGKFIEESLSVIDAKRLMSTLKESALKDCLTGLYNRRFLDDYIDTLISGVLRREKTIGFIMGDLDYFKQVNDIYGHDVGDAVLKETASIIKRSVRSADLVIRFGGEEFLTLLIDINEGEAIMVAEKIRENIQNTKIKMLDGTIHKTISLGISEFPADAQSIWQAIKFADVALYKAKESGRNKSVRFTADMWKDEQF